jgi:hypothetical protein
MDEDDIIDVMLKGSWGVYFRKQAKLRRKKEMAQLRQDLKDKGVDL